MSPEFSVWIIARPLERVPNGLKVMSIGKAALCHWGVLVSPLGLELQAKWNAVATNARLQIDYLETWGNVWELERNPETNQNAPNWISDFGPSKLRSEWKHGGIYYVGTTKAKVWDIELAGTLQTLPELI